jgi:ADP-ribose pyrophosphatase YjhB (NUDIX family)
LPAGFVEPEEDPRAAAQRETAEETGLEVEITSLLDVLHRPDADGLADIVIAYAGHLIRGELTPGDDAVAAGWFPADDLPPLGFRTTEIVLGHWHKRAPQDAKPPDP